MYRSVALSLLTPVALASREKGAGGRFVADFLVYLGNKLNAEVTRFTPLEIWRSVTACEALGVNIWTRDDRLTTATTDRRRRPRRQMTTTTDEDDD